MMKISIKREQSQAGLSFAEREKFRPQVKNKLFLLLALLLTAATGAWADETPLLTIESKDYKSFGSGSKTFDDKVTITFSVEVYNDGDEDGWYAGGTGSLLTVAGTNGYTITSCKFYTKEGDALTGYTVVGESPSVYLSEGRVFTDANRSVIIGAPGINKIEVYGAAAATGYTVSMKNGVKDADKWTVKVGEGQAQALPIGGLKGDGSETVTLTYTGRLKVKGVKATSEAAAEASVPDGAINGKFSVSDGKQVYFSKGNLRYASSKWSFFDNQYDYYTSYSADAWDHFGWSTSAPTYGMNTSTGSSAYSGDFVDWGSNSDLQTALGTGWFTLSSDEWTYLFNTRSASTVSGTENGRYAKAKVNDVPGAILFPDTYTHPDGVAAPTGVNATDATGWNGNSYTAEDWAKMETAGCVFLPAAGYRNGSSVNNAGLRSYYWSATPSGVSYAYQVSFTSANLTPANSYTRRYGCSVRLVCEAAASDAEAAKEPATVTTAPTGAAIVGVGKTTALVSGGVAEGGTMMYKMTTENTKPASTDGFSDAVPTAEDIAASGKVYVWYYVKGDDTHSDSEIAATPIEVPVADVVDLSALTENTELKDGDVLTGTLPGNYKITIADGATVMLDGAVINGANDESCQWAGLTLAGDGTIILSGENSVKGFYENYPGIFVPANKTLTIQGDGSLTATGGDYSPGIGGGYQIACGNIVIEGGTVTATGGRSSAGIGGGRSASCGNISITGGTVTATGGAYSPGIGGGYSASCGNITIANTVTKVTATKGNSTTNSIGASKGGSCGTVTIGGNVTGNISTSPYTYQPSN